jgi:hypothetical protein
MIVIISGCAVKPKYAIQTATGLEGGVSKDTNKGVRLKINVNGVI